MDISGYDKYIVKNILVLDERNKHSKCIFDVIVDNENISEFISENPMGKKEICASVEGEIVFYGTLKKIQCEYTYLNTNVHIEAVSFSDSLDSEKNCRVFQDPDKTYGMLNEFFENRKIKIYCVDKAIGNKKISEILIQNNETDFEFIKKIYAKENISININVAKRTVCCLNVGNLQKSNSLAVQDIKKCERTIYKGYEQIKLATQVLFEVGTKLTLEFLDERYIIISRKIENRCENFEVTYLLIKDNDNSSSLIRKDSLIELGIAKVVANNSDDAKGRIQVEFLNYQNEMSDKKVWIDYVSPLTEKDGGMVFIPDIGEYVEVLMNDKRCVAIGCIRETPLAENLRDINMRYLLSRNCVFKIDKDKLDIEIGKNKLSVDKDIMTLTDGKFEVVIKEDQCKVGFDGSKIILVEDMIHSIGKSKVQVETGELTIVGKNSVEIKTKSFDVG